MDIVGSALASPAPSLSESQLAELLGLVDKSDSVELKLTVPEADQRSAVQALGMDPLNAQIRQVFFFDTPDSRSTRRAWWPAPAGCRERATTRS